MLSRTVADHRQGVVPRSVVNILFFHWITPTIDLFTSRQNAGFSNFGSLYKNKPLAFHMDVLSLLWEILTAYAVSPTGLVSLVLHKVQRDKMLLVILIALIWTRKSWYTLLFDRLGNNIMQLLSQSQYLQLLTWSVQGSLLRHPQPDHGCRTAWSITGDLCKINACHRQQSWPGGVI